LTKQDKTDFRFIYEIEVKLLLFRKLMHILFRKLMHID
jgi:hypothetical protein